MELAKIVLSVESVPRVDIDFMNITHFEEIELVKKIGDTINEHQHSDVETEELTILLDHWLEHTKAHFAAENELMVVTNFPAYPIHAHEHAIALDTMDNVVKAWKRSNDIEKLSDYVFVHWPQWFERHVNTMDMMTAEYAVMRGVSPQADVTTIRM